MMMEEVLAVGDNQENWVIIPKKESSTLLSEYLP